MRKLFYARHFQPTAWDTAEEKAEFANQFIRFVESDFSRQSFTGKFYQRMVCMFGFHAFPNSQNFWDHYFGDEAGRRRFVLSCVGHRHTGDAATTYADVHARLQEWLRARFAALITEADGADTDVFDASPPDAHSPHGEDVNTNVETSDAQRSFAW